MNRALVYRGDTWKGATFQTPVTTLDFTGCTIKSSIRRSASNAAAIAVTVTVTSNTGTAIGGGLSLTKVQTAVLLPGLYDGDVEVTLANGDRYTICTFTLEVIKDTSA